MRFPKLIFLLVLCTQPAHAHDLLLAGKDDPVSTVAQQIVREAYHHLGLDVEFVILPCARALEQSNAGLLDGDDARILAVVDFYPHLLPSPTPVTSIRVCAFVRDLDLAPNDWEDLRSRRVGIRIGAKFAEEITRGWPGIITAPTDHKLFDLLEMGRLDAVITSELVGRAEIFRLGYTTIHAAPSPTKDVELHHFLHTSHADLIPRLDAELQKMRTSGEAERIREETLHSIFADEFYWPRHPLPRPETLPIVTGNPFDQQIREGTPPRLPEASPCPPRTRPSPRPNPARSCCNTLSGGWMGPCRVRPFRSGFARARCAWTAAARNPSTAWRRARRSAFLHILLIRPPARTILP